MRGLPTFSGGILYSLLGTVAGYSHTSVAMKCVCLPCAQNDYPFYFKKERKEKQDIFDMLHCTCKCEMAQSGLIFSIYVVNLVQLPAGFS